MKDLARLLNDLGVSILVVCPDYKLNGGMFEIHELTTACKPSKVISVNVRVNAGKEIT